MNMGARGGQLLTRLIGDRRIHFTDTVGFLRLFRDRVTINAGVPYDMAMDEDSRNSETDLFTRIRVEGAEVAEQYSEAQMVEHGNIFRLYNASEFIEYDDHYREALELLDDAVSYAAPISLQGLIDPRAEAGDIIVVDIGGEKSLIIDQVTLSLNLSETDMAFMMTIEARNA